MQAVHSADSYAKAIVAPALSRIGYALLPVEYYPVVMHRMLRKVKETQTLNITLDEQVWRTRTRLLNFIVKIVLTNAANVLLMEHAKLCFFDDDLEATAYNMVVETFTRWNLYPESVPTNANYVEYVRSFDAVKYAIEMRSTIIGIKLGTITDLTFDGEPEEEVDDQKLLEEIIDNSLVSFLNLQSVLGQLKDGFHEVKRRRILTRMR